MTAIWKLEDFLESFRTRLRRAAYPQSDQSLVSSIPLPEISELFEHQTSKLAKASKIKTKIYESPESMGQTGIYFLVSGANVDDSIIPVATVSTERKRVQDFQDRLIGAFVYHTMLLSKELAPEAVNEFLFPTSLTQHISAFHSDINYLEEEFFRPLKSRPMTIRICGEEEHYLLDDMKLYPPT